MVKKYFTKENIVLVLLVIMLFQGFFSIPSGISNQEHELMLKIHDQSQEIMILEKGRNQDKIIIKKFKYIIIVKLVILI